jgi:hypothetical protein
VERRRSLLGVPPALPYSLLLVPYLAATPKSMCSEFADTLFGLFDLAR